MLRRGARHGSTKERAPSRQGAYYEACVKRLGSSRLRWMVGTALGAVVALPVADARADEGDACLDSSAIGQKLEKDGKLIEARERFAQCANDRCAPDTVAECTRSADRVDEA